MSFWTVFVMAGADIAPGAAPPSFEEPVEYEGARLRSVDEWLLLEAPDRVRRMECIHRIAFDDDAEAGVITIRGLERDENGSPVFALWRIEPFIIDADPEGRDHPVPEDASSEHGGCQDRLSVSPANVGWPRRSGNYRPSSESLPPAT